MMFATDNCFLKVLMALFSYTLVSRSCAFMLNGSKQNFAQISLKKYPSISREMGIRQSSTNSVADFRKEYGSTGLDESKMPKSPFDQFQQWFDEAVQSEVLEPNAMCLSTADPATMRPSARYVLMKGFDSRGFVWYTNYDSRKGQELISNPWASLTFWWGDLERSVRVEGRVEKVSEEESDQYFGSRPAGSQLGALASDQSRPIPNRESLEQKLTNLEASYNENQQKSIPRPSHWGGFRLIPDRMEFWKGRSSRLHDRIVYTLDQDNNNSWIIERLQP
mmetsp:Transcript_34255/g.45283  ORF Transcript_34255/g.45283 Transcript_34255/m.45283 type:complete len:278 (+) Transcript_34255:49-882(+)